MYDKMVRRCGETYLWIYWRMKEMDIRYIFLSILNIILAVSLKDL
jgi:hypothetical protein